MATWQKLSAAIGSATPDPDTSAAAAKPIPPPSVANKPPAGQKGPVGLGPRQTYSRVNTGMPPIPDAGSSSQKSQRPRGLEFLPAKVAHQEKELMTTTMMPRPTLKDLVKEAMEGTVSKVNISMEHARQLSNMGVEGEEEKQASAAPSYTPLEHINKVANALEWLSKKASDGGTPGPGTGPNAIETLTPKATGENIDTKGLGQATSKHVIPQAPPMESSGVAPDPSNAMATNMAMQHPEQPVDPMGNESVKASSALFHKNAARLGLSKEAGGALERTGKSLGRHSEKVEGVSEAAGSGARTAALGAGTALGAAAATKPRAFRAAAKHVGSRFNGGAGSAHGAKAVKALSRRAGKQALVSGAAGAALGAGVGLAKGKFRKGYRAGQVESAEEAAKQSSANELYVRNLLALGLNKLAEDALNPASISGGGTTDPAQPPAAASASEEGVPAEPSDVSKQKSMISSNQSAIDYTKGQAKADPKSDVNKVLTEPALTSSTDPVLQNTLSHTGEAGVKISQDLTRTAAAQALLSKLAEEMNIAKSGPLRKEKSSQMGGGLATPAGQSGFNASGMM